MLTSVTWGWVVLFIRKMSEFKCRYFLNLNFNYNIFVHIIQIVIVETLYGSVRLRRNTHVIFCQRHNADPLIEYTPAHLVNKKAIVAAMKKLV